MLNCKVLLLFFKKGSLSILKDMFSEINKNDKIQFELCSLNEVPKSYKPYNFLLVCKTGNSERERGKIRTDFKAVRKFPMYVISHMELENGEFGVNYKNTIISSVFEAIEREQLEIRNEQLILELEKTNKQLTTQIEANKILMEKKKKMNSYLSHDIKGSMGSLLSLLVILYNNMCLKDVDFKTLSFLDVDLEKTTGLSEDLKRFIFACQQVEGKNVEWQKEMSQALPEECRSDTSRTSSWYGSSMETMIHALDGWKSLIDEFQGFVDCSQFLDKNHKYEFNFVDDLPALIEEKVCLDPLLLSFAKSRDFVIDYDIAKDIGTVKANRNLIVSVTKNFVRNAIKYGKGEKENKILIKMANSKDRKSVIISVQDWGKGIPKDTDIWEYGVQGSSKNLGSGIGLAFVKEAAQWHRGSAYTIDNVKTGSIFCIELPYSGGSNEKLKL